MQHLIAFNNGELATSQKVVRPPKQPQKYGIEAAKTPTKKTTTTTTTIETSTTEKWEKVGEKGGLLRSGEAGEEGDRSKQGRKRGK
jgi:hypothetical protein